MGKKLIQIAKNKENAMENWTPQAFKNRPILRIRHQFGKKMLSESLFYSLAVWYATVKHILAYPSEHEYEFASCAFASAEK